MAIAKVLLDPGHGGNDPGAVGNGLKEKDITLAVCLRAKYHIERHDVEVLMSRTGDTNPTLTQRSNMANSNNVDACASIHVNSASSSLARGVETYTYGKGKNEIALANKVHYAILNRALYSVNRGIKQENFHMVRETKMAAILLEMGFISNDGDANLMNSNIEEFAIAIAQGILEYLGIEYKEVHPYGTRKVVVANKEVCVSNKTSDILNAVEEGLRGTGKIEITMM